MTLDAKKARFRRTTAAIAVALVGLLGLVACGHPSTTSEGPLPGLVPPGENHAGTQSEPERLVVGEELQGEATWYGEPHHGRLTANGETFDMQAFTAAHRTLPFNTIVRVMDRETLRVVVVRINDRGPRKKSRIIDLSRAAADDLGLLQKGVTRVSLEILNWGDGARYREGRKILPKPKR